MYFYCGKLFFCVEPIFPDKNKSGIEKFTFYTKTLSQIDNGAAGKVETADFQRTYKII